ncbi:hypothetical protein GGR56DRAFT_456784 [Xylariaceae sp. FL0804]|nr:hypothetical protein GGR56DRAFT_456784 [Xylariaceae sp. FL0804]
MIAPGPRRVSARDRYCPVPESVACLPTHARLVSLPGNGRMCNAPAGRKLANSPTRRLLCQDAQASRNGIVDRVLGVTERARPAGGLTHLPTYLHTNKLHTCTPTYLHTDTPTHLHTYTLTHAHAHANSPETTHDLESLLAFARPEESQGGDVRHDEACWLVTESSDRSCVIGHAHCCPNVFSRLLWPEYGNDWHLRAASCTGGLNLFPTPVLLALSGFLSFSLPSAFWSDICLLIVCLFVSGLAGARCNYCQACQGVYGLRPQSHYTYEDSDQATWLRVLHLTAHGTWPTHYSARHCTHHSELMYVIEYSHAGLVRPREQTRVSQRRGAAAGNMGNAYHPRNRQPLVAI